VTRVRFCADRLERLPVLCEELLAVYPREELTERAELAVEGLPYARVMTLALRLRAVRDVLAYLPAGFSGWAS
jgi:aryl carrier-like protein